MKYKFIVAVFVIATALSFLIYKAVDSSSKEVMTVAELSELNSKSNVRLGARVSEREIVYKTSPDLLLKFFVVDIPKVAQNSKSEFEVVYNGVMPDTLKSGRDVILEGDFRDGKFYASTLLTQCPSKYEVKEPSKNT